jgi:hypothetical protein
MVGLQVKIKTNSWCSSKEGLTWQLRQGDVNVLEEGFSIKQDEFDKKLYEVYIPKIEKNKNYRDAFMKCGEILSMKEK